MKSAKADCEEILRQNAARFRGNNCVYFKKSQQNYGAKFSQDAADALNQCFLKEELIQKRRQGCPAAHMRAWRNWQTRRI